MNNKVVCFYHPLKEIGQQRNADNMQLVDDWVNCWSLYGWDPVVVSLDEALAHPMAPVILDTSTSLYTKSANGASYLRLCYARWLAYASSDACFWADFDVMNYGATPAFIEGCLNGSSELTFFSRSGCAGFIGRDSNGRPGLYSVLEHFHDIACGSDSGTGKLNEVLSEYKEVSDMTIAQSFCKPYYNIPCGHDAYVVDYGRNELWRKALLVHYDHGFTKIPRHQSIQLARPTASSEIQAPPLQDHAPGKTSERIAWLGAMNDAKNYIEIGVNQGTTFCSSDLDFLSRKVAVDPAFNFPFNEIASDRSVFYEITSDDFFSGSLESGFPADIIFLDGLHTFEQTFRDFCASISLASRKCIWIIDDIRPLSFAQAETDMIKVKKLKSILGEEHGWWMGDVYKVVVAIHDYFPSFSYRVLPGQTGQAVVWQEPRKNFKPAFSSFGDIASMRFQDFLLLSESIFKVSSYEDVSRDIRAWINSI